MIQSIGTERPIKQIGNLILLNPVSPRPMLQLDIPEEKKEEMEAVLAAQRKEIDAIKDPKQKAQAEKTLRSRAKPSEARHRPRQSHGQL